MATNTNRQNLYDTLKRDGYDVRDYDSFQKTLANEENMTNLYNTLKRDGYDVRDLPSFKRTLGYGNVGTGVTERVTPFTPFGEDVPERPKVNVPSFSGYQPSFVPEGIGQPMNVDMTEGAARFYKSAQNAGRMQANADKIASIATGQTRVYEDKTNPYTPYRIPTSFQQQTPKTATGTYILSEEQKKNLLATTEAKELESAGYGEMEILNLLSKQIDNPNKNVLGAAPNAFPYDDRDGDYINAQGEVTNKEDIKHDKEIAEIQQNIESLDQQDRDAYFQLMHGKDEDQYIHDEITNRVRSELNDILADKEAREKEQLSQGGVFTDAYLAGKRGVAVDSQTTYDIAKIRQMLRDLDLPTRANEEKEGVAFVKGAKAGWNTYDMLSGGVADIANSINKTKILGKLERGESITDDEYDALRLLELQGLIESIQQSEGGVQTMAAVGSAVVENLPFMLQMGAFSGLSKAAGKKITKSILKKGADRYSNKLLNKATEYGARFLGGLGKAAVQAPLTTIGYDVYNRLTQDQYFNDAGFLNFNKDGSVSKYQATPTAQRLFIAGAIAFIEAHSELVFGSFIQKGAGTLTKTLGRKMHLDSMLGKVDRSVVLKTLKERVGWNGTLSEFAEEMYANVLQSAISDDPEQSLRESFSAQNLWVTALSTFMMGGMFSVMETPSVVARETQNVALGVKKRNKLNSINDLDLRKQVFSAIKQPTIERKANAFAGIDWQGVSTPDMMAALDYAKYDIEQQIYRDAVAPTKEDAQFMQAMSVVRDNIYTQNGVQTDDMVIATINGENYYVRSGNLESDQPSELIVIADERGATAQVALGDIQAWRKTAATDYLAEQYALITKKRMDIEEIQDAKDVVTEGQQAGIDEATIQEATMSSIDKLENETAVILNDGRKVFIAGRNNGGYRVVEADENGEYPVGTPAMSTIKYSDIQNVVGEDTAEVNEPVMGTLSEGSQEQPDTQDAEVAAEIEEVMTPTAQQEEVMAETYPWGEPLNAQTPPLEDGTPDYDNMGAGEYVRELEKTGLYKTREALKNALIKNKTKLEAQLAELPEPDIDNAEGIKNAMAMRDTLTRKIERINNALTLFEDSNKEEENIPENGNITAENIPETTTPAIEVETPAEEVIVEETPIDTNNTPAVEEQSEVGTKFQYFTGTLPELISQAKQSVQGLIKKVIAPVSPRLKEDLSIKGLIIDEDYNHVIDNNAVRHTLKKHGGKNEEKREQVPIVEADFDRIADVVENYDGIEVLPGNTNAQRIIYQKTYADGTVMFVEEQRVGRKELAAVTMWKKKKPTLTDANRTETTQISDLNGISENKDTNNVPENQTSDEKIAVAEQETNSEPTEAQKEAGNYKKGQGVSQDDASEQKLREQLAIAERQKALQPMVPKQKVLVDAYEQGDEQAIKAWEKQWESLLAMLTIDDMPLIDTTIKDAKEKKGVKLIQTDKGYKVDKDSAIYKAYDYIEKTLKKRKKELEKPEKKSGSTNNKIDTTETVTSKRKNTATPQNTAVSEKKDSKTRVKPKKETDNTQNIRDFGEKITGARKDLYNELAKSLDDATLESLIELPYAKVFKRPNTSKLVANGILRESDAKFVDAFITTYLSRSKPKAKKNDIRLEKSGLITPIKQWAQETYENITRLKDFLAASEQERDTIIEQLLAPETVEVTTEYMYFSNRTRKLINPLRVMMNVFDKLDYNPGDQYTFDKAFIEKKSNGEYSLCAHDGNNDYGYPRSVSQDVAEELIAWQARMKRGDKDINHPASLFYVRQENPITEGVGVYIVGYINRRGGVDTKEFNDKTAADEFAAKHQGNVYEKKETVGYKNAVVVFLNPLSKKETRLKLSTIYDSVDEAQMAITEDYNNINEEVNKRLELTGEKGTERKSDFVIVRVYYPTISYGVQYRGNLADKIVIKDGFKTIEETRAWMDENLSKYEAELQKVRDKRKGFVFFNEKSNPRKGEDYRKGVDATPEMFAEMFGFRGVQFGNWTNQADRQAALNQAFDAFMDLSKIIGISPKAISLGGELGLAFGARGGGKAAAHYELTNVVINLTKTRGAGALAHEWWHALDNYFARQNNVPLGNATQLDSMPTMREELRKAFKVLTNAVKKTPYAKRSADQGAYWGGMHEMTARLFESWVDQKARKVGEYNTFLSGVPSEKEFELWRSINYGMYKLLLNDEQTPMSFEEFKNTPQALDGFPYPDAQETAELGEHLYDLFDTIEEKEEEGKTILFQQGSLLLNNDNPAFEAATEKTMQALEKTGIEVAMATEEQVKAMMEIAEMQKRKSPETALPEDESSFKGTVISSDDGAKILKDIDNAIAEYENKGNSAKTFIGDVARILRAVRRGSKSEYADIITANGILVRIRLADHNVKVSNYDNAGINNGISIVISRKPNENITNDGGAHLVEFFYSDKKISKSDGKPLVEILKSIKQALYSGEYKDNTGLAISEEVNIPEFHRVFHGSAVEFDRFDHSFMGTGEGAQAYGWGTYVTEVEGIGRSYAENTGGNIFVSGFGDFYLKKIREGLAEGKSFEEIKQNLLNYHANIYEKAGGNTDMYGDFIHDYERLRSLKEEDIPKRILYSVEIPDDNGTNYLYWDKEYSADEIEDIANRIGWGVGEFINEDNDSLTGKQIYEDISVIAGVLDTTSSARLASEILHKGGFVGISYPAESMTGGRKDGARNYVIFNTGDLQITDLVRFLRTSDGTVYGWAVNGVIYLTPDGINPNTPVHEYTHLWASAIEQRDPNMWSKIVKAMKQSPVWNEVMVDEAYRDIWNDENRVASEVLSRLSGNENYRRTMQEAAKKENDPTQKLRLIAAWGYVKRTLKNFWDTVKGWFDGNKAMPWEQFVNSAIGDFYKGVNPNVENSPMERSVANGYTPEQMEKEIKNTDPNIVWDALDRYLNSHSIMEAIPAAKRKAFAEKSKQVLPKRVWDEIYNNYRNPDDMINRLAKILSGKKSEVRDTYTSVGYNVLVSWIPTFMNTEDLYKIVSRYKRDKKILTDKQMEEVQREPEKLQKRNTPYYIEPKKESAVKKVVKARIAEKQLEDFKENGLVFNKYDIGAQIRQKLQDSTVAIDLYQNLVEKAFGITITPDTDIYNAINRWSSIAAAKGDKYNDEYLEPLIKTIGEVSEKYDVTFDEIVRYMTAESALERHQSGIMTMADKAEDNPEWNVELVRNYIQEMRGIVPAVELNKIWSLVNRANDFILDNIVDSGIKSAEEKAKIKGHKWKYYLPLMGWDMSAEENDNKDPMALYDFGEGPAHTGFSNRVNMQHAEGRITKPSNPISNMVDFAYKSIIAAENNRMKQVVLNQVNEMEQKDRVLADRVAKVQTRFYVKTSTGSWVEEPFGSEIPQEEIKTSNLARRKADALRRKLGDKKLTPEEKQVILEKINEYLANETVRVVYDNVVSGLLPLEDWRDSKKREVDVFVNGRKITIEFADPAVARAINFEMADPLSKFMRVAGKLSRVIAKVNTSLAPEFVMVNAVRDFKHTMQTQMVQGDMGTAVDTLRNYGGNMWSSAYRGLHSKEKKNPLTYNEMSGLDITRKEDRNKLIEQFGEDRVYDTLFEMFREGGGLTGFAFTRTADDIKKDIKRMSAKYTTVGKSRLNRKYVNPTVQGIKTVTDWATHVAEVAEAASRYSTFITSLDEGKDIRVAISDAKNITVNFNRKGEWTRQLGALYVFFNAAVQALAQQIKLFKDNPMRASVMFLLYHTTKGLLTEWIYQSIKSVLNDDDEEEDRAVSLYQRLNNTVFMFPNGAYIKIPKAQGFDKVFSGLGILLFDALSGVMSANDAIKQFMALLGDSTLPVEMPKDGDFIRTVMPSFVEPLWNLRVNEDGLGYSIYQERYSKSTPSAQLGNRNTARPYVFIAETINEMFGGDEFHSMSLKDDGEVRQFMRRFLEVNPASLQYLFEYFAGGTIYGGRFARHIWNTFIDAFKDNDGEFDANELPIFSRFLGEAKVESPYSEFDRKFEALQNLHDINDKYQEQGIALTDEMIKNEVRYNVINNFNKQCSEIRKLLKAVSPTDEYFKELQREMRDVQRQANILDNTVDWESDNWESQLDTAIELIEQTK